MAPRTEIETLAQLDEHLAHSRSLRGTVLQSLDLRERTDALLAADPAGAVLLGCRLDDVALESVRARGGLVFPVLPDVPMDPYRAGLYSPAELYDTLPDGRYADSLDGRVYAWQQAQPVPPSLSATLATSLHDHAIGDALDDLLEGEDPTRVVGIMGGHALGRGTPAYREAVELGARLAQQGRLVVTGGGPGAMEAANLGAWLSAEPVAARDEDCATLATAPSFRPDIDAWARAAFEVRARHGEGVRNLGIPTWFYGHEPPNAFATDVAKYFSNALREDVLLRACRGGLVYLPGAAGTVQELFQAVTGCYYAADPARVTPLVLVGVEHWTTTLPAWPLLQALSRDRAMGEKVFLVDDVAAALDVLP